MAGEVQLTALRAAEWRFELRLERGGDGPPVVRTLTLAPADGRIVDG